MPVEASDFAEKSALYLPKEAQYSYLVNLPEDIKAANIVAENGQQMNSLGEVVNHAMELVEAQSEQLAGVLPKEYTNFADDLLAELLRIFNNNALDEMCIRDRYCCQWQQASASAGAGESSERNPGYDQHYSEY